MSTPLVMPSMIEAGKVPLREISGFAEEAKLIAIWMAMYEAMEKEQTKSAITRMTRIRPT